MIDTRMARAWRNRSPVTRGHWVSYVKCVLGSEVPRDAIQRFAACLYVACGPDDFGIKPADWEQIEVKLVTYLFNMPEKAMTVYEFHEDRHESIQQMLRS
jgi:hypothetical protein